MRVFVRMRMVMRVRVVMRSGSSMVMRRVRRILVFVAMIMVMRVRERVVMVMPAHAVLHGKFTVFAAITRHAGCGGIALQVFDSLLQQLKDFTFKPKISC